MPNRRPSPFAAEPDSLLKQSAQILWDFVKMHGLSMDLCGHRCAADAIRNVEFLYAEKAEPCPHADIGHFHGNIESPEACPDRAIPMKPLNIKLPLTRKDIDE